MLPFPGRMLILSRLVSYSAVQSINRGRAFEALSSLSAQPFSTGGVPQPVFPLRNLLLRKLLAFRKAVNPAAERAPKSDRAQVRRAQLRAATEAYLQQVRTLAAEQDVPKLVACLATEAPQISKSNLNGSEQATPTPTSSSSTRSNLGRQAKAGEGSARPSNPSLPADTAAAAAAGPTAAVTKQKHGLLGLAAAVATKQLLATTQRAEVGQAFVELLLEKKLLDQQEVAHAMHHVLKAYRDRGDLPGLLRSSSRFYSAPGASGPGSTSGPPSVSQALLVGACGDATAPDVLLSCLSHYTCPGITRGHPLTPVLLHEVTLAAVKCDLREALETERAVQAGESCADAPPEELVPGSREQAEIRDGEAAGWGTSRQNNSSSSSTEWDTGSNSTSSSRDGGSTVKEHLRELKSPAKGVCPVLFASHSTLQEALAMVSGALQSATAAGGVSAEVDLGSVEAMQGTRLSRTLTAALSESSSSRRTRQRQYQAAATAAAAAVPEEAVMTSGHRAAATAAAAGGGGGVVGEVHGFSGLLQQVQQQEQRGWGITEAIPLHHHHQQQQQVAEHSHHQQQQQQQQQEQGLQGKVGLLSPLVGSELLGLTESLADVDGLLLSQLYNPGGLGVDEMGQLVGIIEREIAVQSSLRAGLAGELYDMQGKGGGDGLGFDQKGLDSRGKYNSSSSSKRGKGWQLSDQQQQQQEGAVVAAAMQLRGDQASLSTTPLFPPALPPAVARAAALAYLRLGAVAKASAVAHASCRANPKDMQALHAYVLACARRDWLMPAVNGIGEMRQWYWQSSCPAAQAETLRAVARSSNPPVGAKLHPYKLLTFFNDWCYPHPKTWSALLEGLWLAGDRGQLLWPTLLQAMQQPYPLMALQPIPARHADIGRSKIVGHLMSTMLFAPGASASSAAVAGNSSSSTGGQTGFLQDPPKDLAAVLQPLTANFRYSKRSWSSSSSSGSRSSSRLPLVRQGGGLAAVQHIQSAWQQLLGSGVKIKADHALAAAVPALLYCKDTEDAWRSVGLLPALLAPALELGITPGPRTLKALLKCCHLLEWSPGSQPLAFATPRRAVVAAAAAAGTGADSSSFSSSSSSSSSAAAVWSVSCSSGAAPPQDAPGLVLGGQWVDLNQLLDSCRAALEAAGAPPAALRGSADKVVMEAGSSNHSSSSGGNREGGDTAVVAGDQRFEYLSDAELVSQWLEKFLARHGAEQLALAPLQLAADAIRAKAFEDTVGFVKVARSRKQQQQQQRWEQQGSSKGTSKLGQQQSACTVLGEELAGYELLMPAKRPGAGSWRQKMWKEGNHAAAKGRQGGAAAVGFAKQGPKELVSESSAARWRKDIRR